MSKCGFHIVKKKRDVLYPKRKKYSQSRQSRCSRGRTVHNSFLEDMALKVVELVVFHIEPLKQRVGL